MTNVWWQLHKMWSARPHASDRNFEKFHFSASVACYFSTPKKKETVCHRNFRESPWRWMSIKFNIRLSQILITFRRYFIVHISWFLMILLFFSVFFQLGFSFVQPFYCHFWYTQYTIMNCIASGISRTKPAFDALFWCTN